MGNEQESRWHRWGSEIGEQRYHQGRTGGLEGDGAWGKRQTYWPPNEAEVFLPLCFAFSGTETVYTPNGD